MKLFDEFEAVKFHQEDMIFITCRGWLYYTHDSGYEHWQKYRDAGNTRLTVANYDDVSREELMHAMRGVFPRKETDIMRLCNPAQLSICDMLSLLGEDYACYLSDRAVYHVVYHFLRESDICHKSYAAIRKLLDDAAAKRQGGSQVVISLKELSRRITGRDIFRREIGIVDGHNSSSFFWIMPVRVVDYSDTNDMDNVAEMGSAEISIEENDVAQYLAPFLFKYFDDGLEANWRRVEFSWIDDDGNEQLERVNGFEWYLTHNFYTFEATEQLLRDIADTADALRSGRETEYTAKLKLDERTVPREPPCAGDPDNGDETEAELVVDFYRRFLFRMEYMMKVGREKGYDLISFMGP